MSISRKIFIILSAVILAIFLISAYFYYNFQIGRITEELEKLGEMTGSVLDQSLDISMMSKDYNTILKTLRSLASVKPIIKIWLVNREGIIRASADGKSIGTRLPSSDALSRIIHEKEAKGTFLKEDNTFLWIQPVTNKPQCYGCHDPETKINGVFAIDYSVSEIEQHIRSDIIKGFLILIVSFVLLGLVEGILAKKLVIDRLNIIIKTIERFKEGDYSARMVVKKDDEITRLEEGFNKMAEAINERDREKDILFRQVSHTYEEWQNTFDGITDLISIHDSDFNIIRGNRAFLEYFGLKQKDLTNKKCYELFHWSDTPVIGCPLMETLNKNKPATVEFLDTKTNRILQISTYPFKVPGVEFNGTIHIARDVTEERGKEMRLIMSERLASLGQMAAGIAHEINNPLAAIAGCTEGLLNRLKRERYDPELFKNYLEIIEEEILRCKSITSGMLSFARKTTYEKKEININETLDNTLNIIGFQGRLTEVKVLKNYKEGLRSIYESEGELRQVFLSIITNAIDAMENRGTLTVETGTEENNIFINISDTGPGIPPELINRIFDPFFTTKSEKGGTGLGLSIAKKIINDHSGTIHLTSEIGKGTTFKIMLPL